MTSSMQRWFLSPDRLPCQIAETSPATLKAALPPLAVERFDVVATVAVRDVKSMVVARRIRVGGDVVHMVVEDLVRVRAAP